MERNKISTEIIHRNNKGSVKLKLGEWIAKMRILILLAGALLLIPSVIGIVGTRVN